MTPSRRGSVGSGFAPAKGGANGGDWQHNNNAIQSGSGQSDNREETMKRLALLVLAGLAVGAPTAAWAQDFPTRQITLIAPWPAGGAVDAVCRALAQPLSERLGKSVVVENRPGAGSVIGTAAGAKAAPDGYTMVMAGSGSL